jgi:hypothetical protein
MVQSIKTLGITCSIVVDGEKLKEYDCPEDDKDENASITKYVEAVHGSMYSIQITFDPSCRLDCEWVYTNIFIDGKSMTCGSMVKSALFAKRPYTFLLEGIHNTRSDRTPSMDCFKFATLKTGMTHLVRLP